MAFYPKVSIVIPVYNGSNYMRDAIDSALLQTYKNIEVIVVNDGSNDGDKTRDIALSYGESIRYFEKENGGVATALNCGIQRMTGEYLSWLSHDDIYYPTKIEKQINFLKDYPISKTILYCDFEILDMTNGTLYPPKFITDFVFHDYLRDILLSLFQSSIHGCSTIIPRSCFDDIGIFNEQLRTTQDYEFWFKLVKGGYIFQKIPEVLIKSRLHDEQGIRTLNDVHVQEVNELYIWAFNLFYESFQSFSPECVYQFLNIVKHRYLEKAFNHLIDNYQYDGIRFTSDHYPRKSIDTLSNTPVNEKLQISNLLNKIPGVIFCLRMYRILRNESIRELTKTMFLRIKKSSKKEKRVISSESSSLPIDRSLRILFVGMLGNIHNARWIKQITDQGWNIHIFPSNPWEPHPDLTNLGITVHTLNDEEKKILQSRFISGNPWLNTDQYPDNIFTANLKEVISTVNPDIIHSTEMQHAGYLTLSVREQWEGVFPKWIVTNWGHDIYLFGKLKEHQDRIKRLLTLCDFYSCESYRDVELAKQYGIKESQVLPVMPNAGGFDLDKVWNMRQPGRISERRLLRLTGYQGWYGRALVGLRALERCADVLQGYSIVIYSGGTIDIRIAAELFEYSTNIPVKMLPFVSHDEMLRYHGKARISIGLSISDGASISFIETLVMGSFPIQAYTATSDEWIEDGKTGLIVPPNDPEIIEQAIRLALTSDDLVNTAAEENWKTALQRLGHNRLREIVLNEFYHKVIQALDRRNIEI